jgi:hypothetical protein
LLQPANAHVSLKGLTRQFKAMTSVDKNRERTLVEEPLSNKFDEKRCTRDSKQVRCHCRHSGLTLRFYTCPMALQYKLIIQTRYGLKMNWVVCWVHLQFLSSREDVVVHGSHVTICCMAESYRGWGPD